MKKNFLSMLLLWVCLVMGTIPAEAWKDIKIDLTNGNLLTSDEITNQTTVKFGVAIGDDGTATRVAADDATAAIVLNGKFHSNEHGWGNFSAKVNVDGPVKISMGTCAWGGDVKVVNSKAEAITTFNTNTGKCYHQDKTNNIVSEYYKGTEATTLTISGGNYTPYIAVEQVNEADLKTDYTITYSLGNVTAEGVVPASEKVEAGTSYTIPTNHTLYVDGKTLTAWTDGTKTYKVGEAITPSANMILTPVFTDNTKSLADRTSETTLLWDFQRKNGAPTMSYQNKAGIYVTQANVAGEVIDVKLDFTTNNGGKINNANWSDWAQINKGTTFTIPSCKGAVVSMEAMGKIGVLDGSKNTLTTIDGQSDYETGNTINYTIASSAETVNIIIGDDGTYYRYIKTVLPVIETGGKKYTDEATSIVFPFNGTIDEPQTTPEGVISNTSVSVGSNLQSVNSQADAGITFTRFQPSNKGSYNNAENAVEFKLIPAKNLTFKPTKVSANIRRFGTDGGKMAVRVRNDEGKEITLAQDIKPRRNGKTEDTESFEYEVSEKLATSTGFSLLINIYDNSGKQYGLNNVKIEGTVSGTKAELAKHTITATASPAEAGNITIYPNGNEFEEGTSLKLTATKNFGYKFINWTDAENDVVATENVANITLNKDMALTANFKKLNTYEVKATVAEPGRSYMVQYSPTPTVVDNKNMYEEGTVVTLTAIENDVIKFTSWSTGETTNELKLTVDKNINVTANFAAGDFIAGWDFYTKGSNSRKADFANEDNESATLIMRDEAGNIKGWLDKSVMANNGATPGAATNWQSDGLGKYYWQTTVNAAAFSDIKVKSSMQYNYNAYQKYNLEYSLDGTTWETAGVIDMGTTPKTWKETEFQLPENANNKDFVYIRWKADKTSDINGADSKNDGVTIANIYITGTPKIVDDGTAPKLLSTIPAQNATNVSAAGKIVFNFDKKIKIEGLSTINLNGKNIEPVASGKSIIINYGNLDYNTSYTIALPANTVSDLCGNKISEDVSLSFTTMNRPSVEKAMYDFVVPTDGTLQQAFKAAESRKDTSKRFRIFVKNGNYVIPASTTATKTSGNGKTYPDPTTYLTTPNISIIGESRDGVVITNTVPNEEYKNGFGMANVLEGIGTGDVLCLKSGATNTYMQGLTMKSAMGDKKGRDIVLNDQSNKTICKDVCLWAYQDTYVSNNERSRFYFEGGLLRGNTDFLCGKGDVYYNNVDLQMCGTGYMAVPSVPTKYGYIFNDCTIKAETDGIDGNYTLGRPWGKGTPVALFINTKMEAMPSGEGWSEMTDGYPARFAEYNSVNAKGNPIDMSNRKKLFASTHENNPVLTAEEAAKYTIATVMGGDDDWNPTLYTEQANAPKNVAFNGKQLTWDDNDYALCWAVCHNGSVAGFTTTNSYDLTEEKFNDGSWSVRAANEMGGLGEAAEAVAITATLSAGGMGTFCSATSCKAPEGLNVYTASVSNNNTVTLNKVNNGIIPAREGVVLGGEASKTYYMTPCEAQGKLEGNRLKGTMERTLIEDDYSFVLVYDKTEDVSYFKNFQNGAYIPAGKAYLKIPTAVQGAQLKVVINNGTSGINSFNADGNNNGAYFTISGQKTMKPQRGLYIHNGKKIIIK